MIELVSSDLRAHPANLLLLALMNFTLYTTRENASHDLVAKPKIFVPQKKLFLTSPIRKTAILTPPPKKSRPIIVEDPFLHRSVALRQRL